MKYKIDIEEFLRKNNLTQTQLGDYLGIGQPQISGICHGKPIARKHIEKILENKEWDLTMITEDTSKRKGDDVIMSREVFDLIKQQTDTILSQQRTIENLSNKRGDVQMEDNADYADVSGSDLER